MPQRKAPLMMLFAVVFVLLMMTGINIWLQSRLGVADPPAPVTVPARENPTAAKPPPRPQGEVWRITRVVRDPGYIEHVFLIGNREIARRKEDRGRIIESSGTIPDGEVRFFDYYHNSRGIEYYQNGIKHGEAKTIYPSGELWTVSNYNEGRLMSHREYLENGQLRASMNYEDVPPQERNSEVGVGKLYGFGGYLKYEWNIQADGQGFKKAYTSDGTLRYEAHYGKDGELLRETTYP